MSAVIYMSDYIARNQVQGSHAMVESPQHLEVCESSSKKAYVARSVKQIVLDDVKNFMDYFFG